MRGLAAMRTWREFIYRGVRDVAGNNLVPANVLAVFVSLQLVYPIGNVLRTATQLDLRVQKPQRLSMLLQALSTNCVGQGTEDGRTNTS